MSNVHLAVDGASADVLPPPLYPVHARLGAGVQRELQVKHVDVRDAEEENLCHHYYISLK